MKQIPNKGDEAIPYAVELWLREHTNATEGEIDFLLACQLPTTLETVGDWCSENLDDLRRQR